MAKEEAGTETRSFQFYLLLKAGSPQPWFSILAVAVYFQHLQTRLICLLTKHHQLAAAPSVASPQTSEPQL